MSLPPGADITDILPKWHLPLWKLSWRPVHLPVSWLIAIETHIKTNRPSGIAVSQSYRTEYIPTWVTNQVPLEYWHFPTATTVVGTRNLGDDGVTTTPSELTTSTETYVFRPSTAAFASIPCFVADQSQNQRRWLTGGARFAASATGGHHVCFRCRSTRIKCQAA